MSSAERSLLAIAVVFSAIAAIVSVLLWLGFFLVLTEQMPIPCDCSLRCDAPSRRYR
jgi:hypothetical protein